MRDDRQDGMEDLREPSLTATADKTAEGWSVKVDTTKLFTVLAKIALDAKYGTLVGAIKSALDLPTAFGDAGEVARTPGEQAWLLIHRALMRALAWTIRDHQPELGRMPTEPEIALFLRTLTPEGPFEVTRAFFDRPQASALVQSLLPRFRAWLDLLQVPAARQGALCHKLARELPLALDAEERASRTAYAAVTAHFGQGTLAGAAAQRERDWRRYRAALVDAVRTPLFNLDPDEPGAVALSDVYIPLRAYWIDTPADADKAERRAPGKQPEGPRMVVWLADEIRGWVKQGKPADAVRVLSGDPGCGKSSFAQMLAAGLAAEQRRVLLVPLHRFDFQQDALEALTRFTALPDELGHNPADHLDESDPLLIIFDGLDEVARAGGSAADAARQFVDHLITQFVHARNNGKRRLLILLAGRPVVTAECTAAFKDKRDHLYALRYVTRNQRGIEYRFADKHQQADQRDEWWRRFGARTGQPIGALPPEYKNTDDRIDEITEQPLLNYLLALLRGHSKASLNNPHALYTAMFDYIYHGVNRPGLGRTPTKGLTKDDYTTLLEEIALAAWHNGDRAVSIQALEKHFADAGHAELLTLHFATIRGGVKVMLNSFFIQPRGDVGGNCEFTHKSFREYLTARRLVRAMTDLHDGRKYLKPAESLERWFALTGPTALDFDLLTFFREEVAAHPDAAAAWLKTLTGLFNLSLRDGMPPTLPRVDGTFRQLQSRSRNAEECLLAAINACARAHIDNPPLISFDWGDDQFAAGNMIHRLGGQGYNRTITTTCLSYINYSNQNLHSQDFCDADLTLTNLRKCNLTGAFLGGAVLTGSTMDEVDISDAILICANMSHTTLHKAVVRNSNLWNANLSNSELISSSFRNSNLREANLFRSNIAYANFTSSDLREANLSETIAIGASFSGADLRDANLGKSLLPGANLTGADITGAYLRGTKITTALQRVTETK